MLSEDTNMHSLAISTKSPITKRTTSLQQTPNPHYNHKLINTPETPEELFTSKFKIPSSAAASNSQQQPDFQQPRNVVTIKVMLLGDSGVGKTQLFNIIKKSAFQEFSMPTAGIDFSSMTVKIDECTSVKAQILDSSGSDRYKR